MRYLLLSVFSLLTICLHSQESHYQNFNSVKETKEFFRTSRENQIPIISGHRGGIFANLPENALVTFEYVLSNTPAIFEVDIRMTKDGEVMLLHDDSLDRTTTGSGKIRDYDLEDLKALKLLDSRGYFTSFDVPSLEETIRWSKGRTVINLDVKDVPISKKAAIVQIQDAFAHVIFTVHTPEQAIALYHHDQRSMFSAFIKTQQDFEAFEASEVPWENILIAYVGPYSKEENRSLYELLHQNGVSVMVSAASSYDKIEDPVARAEAYQKVILDGADVLETDRPLEVMEALNGLKSR